MNINIKKRHLFLLSFISGLLLALGWPSNGFPFLLFIGFIPILFIENHIYKNQEQFNCFSFFKYCFVSMFIWNTLTTYWIYFSTFFGAAMAVLLNSLFMAITLSFFHYSRTTLKHNSSYITFIIFWISFEYLHLDWDLSWSWMNLGNGFANHPAWVQWYEYSGCFGGTFWILLTNYIFFKIIKIFILKEKLFKSRVYWVVAGIGIIIIPIIISVCLYYSYENKGKPANVVIVQPNIDPYNEKFGGMTSEQQLSKLLKIAKLKTDNKTDLLIGPETAIPEAVWEDKLDESNSIDSLKLFINKYPQLNILIGMSSYKMFREGEIISATARRYPFENRWYDAYNTAIMIDTSKNIQIYHKSKLVAGVEKMPFPKLLKPLEKFALDLGGTVGSLGIQEERTVFTSVNKIISAAPVICYESVYGEYVSEYVRNGANIICVITNDGWWKDTPGYKQHFDYARLRAIETRRCVAQSANTGISGFIDQRGDVLQKTSWWQGDVLKQKILLNEEKTFYVNHGDYLARISYYISLLILLYSIFLSIVKKFKRKIPE